MQTELTETSTLVYSTIPVSLELLSSTKDSIHVKWYFEDHSFKAKLEGYKLQYRAEGSHVVQHTQSILPPKSDYDIKNLHEDTQYSICLEMFPDLSKPYVDHTCLETTTSTDSLSVALGSTFGAFLALGIIIMFVFIAKWQHTQRIRKRMSVSEQTAKACECEDCGELDPEMETSGLSMQVNEDTIKFSEIDSAASSQVSLQLQQHQTDDPMANGIVVAAGSLQNCSSDCSDPLSSINLRTNSTECCTYSPSCSHTNCTIIECGQNSPHIKRFKRGYLIRQKSIESQPSRLGYQLSLDSYESSCRGSLPRQFSQDSSRCSSCSHTQLLIKQKSQDSAYLNQKYLAPTADGTYEEFNNGDTTMNNGSHNRYSPDYSSKQYSSHGILNKSHNHHKHPYQAPESHQQYQNYYTKHPHDNNNRSDSPHKTTEISNKPPDVRPKDRSEYSGLNTDNKKTANTPNDPLLNAHINNSQSINLSGLEQAQAASERNGQMIGTLRTNNSCPSW